ncbi:MAG TPA: hypothetical protein VF208_01825 [Candidatus Binatia bacterium]
MTPECDGETLEYTSETRAIETGAEASAEAVLAGNCAEAAPVRVSLTWIGTLANPHLGPMVVVGDGGYLVPVWTAGELLRGCKYVLHRSQE